MSTWRWSACDLQTGRLLAELPLAASGAVSRVLCGTGNGTFRLPLTDPATPSSGGRPPRPDRTVIVGERAAFLRYAAVSRGRGRPPRSVPGSVRSC